MLRTIEIAEIAAEFEIAEGYAVPQGQQIARSIAAAETLEDAAKILAGYRAQLRQSIAVASDIELRYSAGSKRADAAWSAVVVDEFAVAVALASFDFLAEALAS